MVRLLVEEVLVDSINEKLTVKHVIPLDKSFPLRSGRNRTSLHGPGFSRKQSALVEHPGLEPGPQLAPQGWTRIDFSQQSFLINPVIAFFGLDHRTGHLASMSILENECLDPLAG